MNKYAGLSMCVVESDQFVDLNKLIDEQVGLMFKRALEDGRELMPTDIQSISPTTISLPPAPLSEQANLTRAATEKAIAQTATPTTNVNQPALTAQGRTPLNNLVPPEQDPQNAGTSIDARKEGSVKPSKYAGLNYLTGYTKAAQFASSPFTANPYAKPGILRGIGNVIGGLARTNPIVYAGQMLGSTLGGYAGTGGAGAKEQFLSSAMSPTNQMATGMTQALKGVAGAGHYLSGLHAGGAGEASKRYQQAMKNLTVQQPTVAKPQVTQIPQAPKPVAASPTSSVAGGKAIEPDSQRTGMPQAPQTGVFVGGNRWSPGQNISSMMRPQTGPQTPQIGQAYATSGRTGQRIQPAANRPQTSYPLDIGVGIAQGYGRLQPKAPTGQTPAQTAGNVNPYGFKLNLKPYSLPGGSHLKAFS